MKLHENLGFVSLAEIAKKTEKNYHTVYYLIDSNSDMPKPTHVLRNRKRKYYTIEEAKKIISWLKKIG